MAKQLLLAFFCSFALMTAHSQDTEHGFLPAKPFQFYPTIGKYDFHGRRVFLKLRDVRDSLHLEKIPCSKVKITNGSEFAGAVGEEKVMDYFAHLFPDAGLVIDPTSTDTLNVYLEALDDRLIGFVVARAHGLCLMRFEGMGISQTYCVDITDKDPHCPVSSSALLTRATASRIIQSASIREVIEKFFIDLKAK